eukprot:CAMPEP_0116999322 /NCGR_PEP_ID=MMETSP0472-20121206/2068_1 /TAXON_ID=693140 ORGANISM="Tiarina fusus, Strain LIS" /NCGR_SAMPLE_ID=MMETSP0472 /ASSEMBLY_ACC=CAM_ASM_000603 /LENGTH=375 /DNA_ID=CAMNT_0004698707 /DNA_START=2203 /DNA_END=3327 /DNA_ORIENTATION=+
MTKLSQLPEVQQHPHLKNFLARVQRSESSSMKRSRKKASSATNSPVRTSSARLRSEGSFGVPVGRINSHSPVSPLQTEEIESTLLLEQFSSQFYDWSKQYFAQNFSELNAEPDETSPVSLERNWRRKKQQGYYEHTLKNRDIAGKSKFETQIAIINDNSIDVPSFLCLHPSEPICIFSDNRSNISVWNWQESFRLSLFSNLSSTPITALSLINTQERFRIVTGTSDGIVRVWGTVDDSPKLASSWRAFSDDPSRSFPNRGLVFDWDDTEECLLTSGITPVIRMWNIEKGLSVQDIASSDTKNPITSITHHQDQPLFVTGSGSGTIEVFDARVPPTYSSVLRFTEHKARIINTKIPRSVNGNLMLSGAASGVVKLW